MRNPVPATATVTGRDDLPPLSSLQPSPSFAPLCTRPIALAITAVTDEPLRRRPDGKLHFVRVRAEWSDTDARFHVRSSGGQASHLLRAMALANALVLLPDGDGVDAGAEVRVMLLSWPD